jgi:replication factor C subunit 2/4
MNITKQKPLLSELLRPQQLGDIILPEPFIDQLQKMADEGSIMNMIFHGRPGLGKTTAARLLVEDKTKFAVNHLQGSLDNGIELVRSLDTRASHVSYSGCPKVFVVDEADFLSKQAQAGLRHVVENHSSRARFLFTANEIGKISQALRSRMKEICFDLPPVCWPQTTERLVANYEKRLSALEIKFDPRRLRELVGIYFPDLRSIANQLEFEFA